MLKEPGFTHVSTLLFDGEPGASQDQIQRVLGPNIRVVQFKAGGTELVKSYRAEASIRVFKSKMKIYCTLQKKPLHIFWRKFCTRVVGVINRSRVAGQNLKSNQVTIENAHLVLRPGVKLAQYFGLPRQLKHLGPPKFKVGDSVVLKRRSTRLGTFPKKISVWGQDESKVRKIVNFKYHTASQQSTNENELYIVELYKVEGFPKRWFNISDIGLRTQ